MWMKPAGVVRKMDELGRIVLPIEFRRALEIGEKDRLEFILDGDKLILKKFDESCLFCSATRDLVTYRGRNVCVHCIRKMNNT